MSNRIIVITGASTGLGLALAVRFARAGDTVYATMRDIAKSDAVRAAAADAPGRLEVRELDVTKPDSVDACFDAILEEAGHIDVLINNAGAGYARSTEQSTEDDVRWVMELNFMGVMRCTKAVLAGMRQRRSGHVINISSVGGLVGQPFNEIYCAAKFAVEGYTEALASYVQPAFGVKFTAVEPGGIRSEFAQRALQQIMDTGGMLEDEYLPLLQKYVGMSQTRGAGVFQTPEEVAEVVFGCAGQAEPPVRMRTSEWSNELCALKTQADPDGRKLQAKVIDMFLGGV